MERRFPHLEKAAQEPGSAAGDLSPAQLRVLLCLDCDFYTDDHEDELECSCFQMLRLLLEKRVLTPGALAEAVTSEDSDS